MVISGTILRMVTFVIMIFVPGVVPLDLEQNR